MARIFYSATHAFSSPIRVGSHHIARLLSCEHQVCYSSHPLSVASVLSPKQNQVRERTQPSFKNSSTTTTKIEHLLPKFLLAPGNRFPLNTGPVLDHSWRTSVPPICRQLRRRGWIEPDWLVLDSIYQSFWIDLLQPRKLMVRIADLPAAMGGYGPALRKRFEQAVAQADLVVAPSEAIATYAGKINSDAVLTIPNGIDVGHLQRPRSCPALFSNETRKKVIFVGALASWIDTALIDALARMAPEIVFYLIGPNHGVAHGTLSAPNITILGPLAYQDMPAYLQHADVAIAPFNVRDHPELMQAVSAIKLYEYIACGLPVIASEWPQSQQLQKSLPKHTYTCEQEPLAWLQQLQDALSAQRAPISEGLLSEWDWSTRLAPAFKRIAGS